jgi:heptaprenyl diphosphate synthase
MSKLPCRSPSFWAVVTAPANPLVDMPGMPVLRERIEKRLAAAVESGDPAMTEMASHLVRAGGKRLRPVLAALASAAATGPASVGDDVVTGGVACELVHVGSLHHDDVIDEAPTRHRVDSVNARWGNLRAILSGDFLLARASELAASLGPEVASLLAATIGRLCEGQVRELQFAYQVDRTDADYTAAIEGKTAALFATACRIGALVAEAPPAEVDALGEFGRGFGLAFQVVDDVLDVTATDEELGKPAGHDMAEGVYTLPVLHTLASPGEGPEELRSLLGGPLGSEDQARALDLVRAGEGVAVATERARGYVEDAVAALAALPPSPAGETLAAGARHLVEALAR